MEVDGEVEEDESTSVVGVGGGLLVGMIKGDGVGIGIIVGGLGGGEVDKDREVVLTGAAAHRESNAGKESF